MTERPRDVWGSVVPVDMLGNDEREPRPGLGRPAWLSGGAVIGVLAVVISVVMGAGIFAAASLSGGGPQPEDVLPGTAFAFAKLDLDPPAGQKLAVRELASKFPKAPAKEADGLRDALLRELLEGTGTSYEADVKPWLGSRAGIAGFRPAGGTPAVVAAIQTKDREKTRAALTKEGSDALAFAFRSGYVLITEDPKTLDYALDSVDKGPLSEDPEFRADSDALDGDQVLMVWVDNAAATDAMAADGNGDDDTFGGQLRGRSVLGLHATRDYVELQSITIGAGVDLAGGATDTLRRLPADTAGALLLHDVSKVADNGVTGAGAAVFAAQGLYFPFFFFAMADSSEAFESDEYDDSDYARCAAPASPVPPAPSSPVPPAPGSVPPPPGQPASPAPPVTPEQCPEYLPPPPEERANRTPWGGDWTKAADVFRDDLLPLLNDQSTFSLGSYPRDHEAKFPAGVVARVNGPGNAVEPFQDFLDALGVKVPVRLQGDLVYAATDQAYQDSVARDGKLGESDLFGSAMGDLGDSVVVAAYVNLDAAEKTYPEFPEELRPVDAIGISMATEGDRVTSRLRIVVR